MTQYRKYLKIALIKKPLAKVRQQITTLVVRHMFLLIYRGDLLIVVLPVVCSIVLYITTLFKENTFFDKLGLFWKLLLTRCTRGPSP